MEYKNYGEIQHYQLITNNIIYNTALIIEIRKITSNAFIVLNNIMHNKGVSSSRCMNKTNEMKDVK
jgi:hypothetical protein